MDDVSALHQARLHRRAQHLVHPLPVRLLVRPHHEEPLRFAGGHGLGHAGAVDDVVRKAEDQPDVVHRAAIGTLRTTPWARRQAWYRPAAER